MNNWSGLVSKYNTCKIFIKRPIFSNSSRTWNLISEVSKCGQNYPYNISAVLDTTLARSVELSALSQPSVAVDSAPKAGHIYDEGYELKVKHIKKRMCYVTKASRFLINKDSCNHQDYKSS